MISGYESVMSASLFYRRVDRKVIAYKRIHKFAVNRWMNARTPIAAKFWNGVMNRCVVEIRTWEFDEEFYRRVFGRGIGR